ncbi:hypothetical protein DM992_39280 (plasmid) [Burkholderia sp. JP2-270]|uniref:hypothetical protein n=1 Tax=Burkholderia sp. JP2-270 TaxID=2217913 RepID=UPI000DA4256B|nr:hypothetical protein [Burkholderia sp. JP2-270]AWV05388.1 hypothetical protein DM992_39280 [Burkholderia sp. JP2-270]
MARHLRTQKQIDAFIAQVIQQAIHHASQVAQIIQPLANAVLGHSAFSRLEVYERNGNLARTCWVTVGTNRWVFSYSYGQHVIELRKDSTRGPVVFQFDNHTSAAALSQQVSRL